MKIYIEESQGSDSIIILNSKEAKILGEAMEEYCKKYPRRLNATKINDQFYK